MVALRQKLTDLYVFAQKRLQPATDETSAQWAEPVQQLIPLSIISAMRECADEAGFSRTEIVLKDETVLRLETGFDTFRDAFGQAASRAAGSGRYGKPFSAILSLPRPAETEAVKIGMHDEPRYPSWKRGRQIVFW